MNDLDEYVETLKPRLQEMGIRVVRERLGGPMGSKVWSFSGDGIQLDIHSDRGHPAVTVGIEGRPTFGFQPWCKVLDIPELKAIEFEDQVEFFLGHVPRLRQVIRRDEGIEEKLREANWAAVKAHLGLRQTMPRPGSSNGDSGMA